MPLDFIRDSFVGQLIYYISGGRILRHPEDKPTFSLPARYNTSQRNLDVPSETVTLTDQRKQSRVITNERSKSVAEEEILRSSQDVEKADMTKVKDPVHDTNLVTWYGPDDPDYPQNWSLLKRCFVTFDICVLTFSIYIGSSIYAPGIADLSSEFGVSTTAATLGLTMFIVGYGVGPMFLAPLSEIPQLGRTTVYIVSLLIFVVIQVPTALCKNLGALLPLRFIAGFVGSPALATGAASLLDMWRPEDWPVVVGLWSVAGTCGPVLGPLIGGFAAEAKGWDWTIWILLWLAGGSLAFLSIFLPETSGQA
ncbi:hypothetical protein PHLCEN_2v12715 [Hermanssonia centrifuga]|uniref:Major facilitator superfamily (MFS) profile domain-containing protein n=1 Tax=Hermanssonia centrifuga TaxID=98765 RepID=A0A2R6NGS6_9APHY|nr:hypothetical protein PHLCEN_2v12715 [Hermanssonia centrifuga]